MRICFTPLSKKSGDFRKNRDYKILKGDGFTLPHTVQEKFNIPLRSFQNGSSQSYMMKTNGFNVFSNRTDHLPMDFSILHNSASLNEIASSFELRLD